MPRVRLPDGRLVRFPDEMTTQDIEAAVMTLMGPAGPVPASEQPPLERPSTSGFLKKLAASGIETAGSVVPGMARLLKTAVTDPREAGRMMVEGIAQPIEALAGDPLGTIYEHPGAPLGVAANIAGAGLGLRTAIRTPSAAVRGGVALQRLGEHVPSSITPTFSVPYTLARAVTGPTLRTTGRALERGGRLFGGNVPFHERPLYEQMGQLPETSAPPMTRTGGPPYAPPTRAAGPGARLVKGDPATMAQRLQETLDETRARAERVETVTGPPSVTSMTPLGRPATGPQWAGRERRAAQQGLKEGMTERRHRELLATKFGGTQTPTTPAPALPAALEPFVSKSKSPPVVTMTANDVEGLSAQSRAALEVIRDEVVTKRRGRQAGYKADAEVRKELERLMTEPD